MTVETPENFYVASLTLKHSLQARPCAVTFGVQNTAAGTPTVAADAVLTAVKNILVAAIDTNVLIGPVSLHGGTPADPIAAVSTGALVPGTRAMTGMPPNCDVLVEKNTARGGRRGRGRMFFPFMLSQTEVSEAGIITAGVITTLTTLFNNFRTALNTQQVPMHVLHSPGISATNAPDLVTGLTVDSVIGSQRRRLGR